MTYQMEQLVALRLADLRRAGERSRRLPARPATSGRSVRETLGGVLVRLGDRLAEPASETTR